MKWLKVEVKDYPNSNAIYETKIVRMVRILRYVLVSDLYVIVMEVPILTFTKQTMKLQNFPIRKPLLDFIFKNASASVMSKLFRTCRYFYNRKPYCIVENITVLSDGAIQVELNNDKFRFEKIENMELFDNIWVANEINFFEWHPEMLFNKIARCHSVNLRAHFPITKYPFVKECIHIDSHSNAIVDEVGNIVSLQKLLLHLPNAVTIR